MSTRIVPDKVPFVGPRGLQPRTVTVLAALTQIPGQRESVSRRCCCRCIDAGQCRAIPGESAGEGRSRNRADDGLISDEAISAESGERRASAGWQHG
jgi:hypothetical protein